jgi:hypothetical protein
MVDVVDRLIATSKSSTTSEEDIADMTRLRDEWQAARQSIEVCSRAGSFMKANVSTIENDATGNENTQYLVSTNGKALHGKNKGHGHKNTQFGGYMSDVSLQVVTRTIFAINLETSDEAACSSHDDASLSPDDIVEQPNVNFQERHGPGKTLEAKSHPNSKSVPNINKTPKS